MAVDAREHLLSPKAVADRLDLSERTVRAMIARGVEQPTAPDALPSIKIGGARKVEPQVLDAFIASRRGQQ